MALLPTMERWRNFSRGSFHFMSRQQRFHGWKLANVALLAAGACDGGRQLRGDAPQIGLARGAHWSVVSLRPPHLNGPFFQLMLRQHVLTGWIAGDSAPGGALRVRSHAG